nr:H427 [uncultured bacterium]
MLELPASKTSCPSITAFMAEPHILVSVVHPAEPGSPPPNAACRAGACL